MQLDDRSTLRRHLAPVVLAPHLEMDELASVLDGLVGHLAFAPGDVAQVVELPVLHLDAAQHAVVAHPVRRHLRHPRATLDAEVVGPGQAEQVLREDVVPVHALRRFGHALLVRDHQLGVLAVEIHRHLVADQIDAEERLERDLGGGRERALDDRRQLVADLHVRPVAIGRALLGVVLLVEILDLFRLPLGEPGLSVLRRLLRLVPLVADPGVLAQPDLLALLVPVLRFVRLVDRAPAGEAALHLAHRVQVGLRGQHIAELERLLVLVERARPDRVHTREALRQAGAADGTQRVHAVQHDRRREQRAPAGLLRVLLVDVHRAQVADRECQMIDSVARHLGAPGAAVLKSLSDAGEDLRQALVGDLAVLDFRLLLHVFSLVLFR